MKTLRELYRIGHGPSSSHTMGPAVAAAAFRKAFPKAVLPFHPNGLTVSGFDARGRQVGSRTYYSVGGGVVVEEGRSDESPDVYPYRNMDEILSWCEREGEPLWHVVEACEGKDIWAYLDTVLTAMDAALDRGLCAEGALEGGLHLVSFDTVIRTMVQTGHDLPSLYRETSTGGLSLYVGLAADPAAE